MSVIRYQIRPATAREASAIRGLIWQVGINPMGLDWRRFLLAVDEGERMIGCGQVKPHGDGVRELASMAVLSPYRGQGIASAIIQRLLAENPRPIYLICQPTLQPFYTRFGFTSVPLLETPSSLRWMSRLFHVAVMVQREEEIQANRQIHS